MKTAWLHDRSFRYIGLTLLVALTTVSLVLAQEKKRSEEKTPVRPRTTPVTSGLPAARPNAPPSENGEGKLSLEQRRQREDDALAFANKHHPDLEKLLRQLRGMDPKEYAKAIRELHRVSERLGQLKERNPYTYEIQLELWKASSSAMLLAARLQLNPGDEDLRQELREALEQKLATQKRLSEEELRRAELRVQRLKQNLQRLDQEGPALIQRQMRQLDPRKNDRK